MRWAGHATKNGALTNAYISIRKREKKRPLGKPRSEWENDKMDLKKKRDV
jgi:hypothetical protein